VCSECFFQVYFLPFPSRLNAKHSSWMHDLIYLTFPLLLSFSSFFFQKRLLY
jgi:hypothetical protein